METLASSRQYIRGLDRLFITGEWGDPATTSRIEVIDSATEGVFLTVAEAQANGSWTGGWGRRSAPLPRDHGDDLRDGPLVAS